MRASRAKVLVYGTLLAGEHNHRLLASARCLGEATTCEGFALFVAFFVGALRSMWRALPRITDASAQDDLWATFRGLTAFGLLMWTEDLFYRLPTFVLFWTTLGLGLGVALFYAPGPRKFYRLVHFRHKL